MSFSTNAVKCAQYPLIHLQQFTCEHITLVNPL